VEAPRGTSVATLLAKAHERKGRLAHIDADLENELARFKYRKA